MRIIEEAPMSSNKWGPIFSSFETNCFSLVHAGNISVLLIKGIKLSKTPGEDFSVIKIVYGLLVTSLSLLCSHELKHSTIQLPPLKKINLLNYGFMSLLGVFFFPSHFSQFSMTNASLDFSDQCSMQGADFWESYSMVNYFSFLYISRTR